MEEKLDALIKTVRRIEESQASMDRDMEKDRQNLQDLNIRIASVEEGFTQLRASVNQLAERVKDKVVDAIEASTGPVTKAVERFTKSIKKKKVVEVPEDKSLVDKILGK